MVCPGPTRQPTLSNGHVNGHRTTTHLASPGHPCSLEEGSTDVSLVLNPAEDRRPKWAESQFKYVNAAFAFLHGWRLSKGELPRVHIVYYICTGTRVCMSLPIFFFFLLRKSSEECLESQADRFCLGIFSPPEPKTAVSFMNNNRINGPAVSDRRQGAHLMLLAKIKKEKYYIYIYIYKIYIYYIKYENYWTLAGKINWGHQRGVMLMC